MKESVLSILLLLTTASCALGQAYTSKGVIRYAKTLDVAKLDPTLSHQPLDRWLQGASLRLDTVRWAVSDCDFKPSNDDVDWPLCAKFWFRRRTHDAGGWGLLQVGTTKKGITGAARLRMVVVSGISQIGKFSDSERLSDLPRLLDEASAAKR